MEILDRKRYAAYRAARDAWSPREKFFAELGLPMLLFGSVGAVTWAVRGTSGLGGLDGALVPGMAWGLLWVFTCHMRGVDGRVAGFWLGLGISIGGLLGYGVYVSWTTGVFQLSAQDSLPVGPAVGFTWHAACGAAWGGIGGVVLGWTLGGHASKRRWLARAVVPGASAVAGVLAFLLLPHLFLPHYSAELYSGASCPLCDRVASTTATNLAFASWWVGALLVAAVGRDRRTLKYGGLLGIGFGLVFSSTSAWNLMAAVAPGFIDWWKVWELSIGFGVGCLYAVVLHLELGELNRAHDATGGDPVTPDPRRGDRSSRRPDRGATYLALTLFAFVILLAYGPSYNLGILLGLYDSGVDQYQFPLARVVVLLPLAVASIGFLCHRLHRLSRASPDWLGRDFRRVLSPRRIHYLLCYLLLMAVVSLWPSKVVVLYVALYFLAFHSVEALGTKLPPVDAVDLSGK
ncbi:MAG: hypothetical protein ACTSU5_07350 [Promethearchaeota archaeon]